jgi:hypothetical protein
MSAIPTHKPQPIVTCSVCQTKVQYSPPENHANEPLSLKCFSCKSIFQHSPSKSSFPKRESPKRRGTDENPADLEYYNLLEVEHTATPAQIKKAYYVMAMKYHPDKHPDDPNAEENFKKIAEAYQVLSDPQKRAIYNAQGKSSNAVMEFDAGAFFKQQFGGDLFTDIIGEISIANELQEALKSGGANREASSSDAHLSNEERMVIRESRISTLTEKLVAKLAIYVDATPLKVVEPQMVITFEEIAKD